MLELDEDTYEGNTPYYKRFFQWYDRHIRFLRTVGTGNCQDHPDAHKSWEQIVEEENLERPT